MLADEFDPDEYVEIPLDAELRMAECRQDLSGPGPDAVIFGECDSEGVEVIMEFLESGLGRTPSAVCGDPMSIPRGCPLAVFYGCGPISEYGFEEPEGCTARGMIGFSDGGIPAIRIRKTGKPGGHAFRKAVWNQLAWAWKMLREGDQAFAGRTEAVRMDIDASGDDRPAPPQP